MSFYKKNGSQICEKYNLNFDKVKFPMEVSPIDEMLDFEKRNNLAIMVYETDNYGQIRSIK